MIRRLICMILLLIVTMAAPAQQETGRRLFMQYCIWCHGEQGDGNGPSAEGMFPRPRDLIRGDYLIRSTPHGQLPTDEDISRTVAKGLPGTPMPAWEKILSEQERGDLVTFLKSLSPRFETEKRESLTIPAAAGSIERGEEIYRDSRCYMCHGEAGRGDGPITTTLAFEWGFPYQARDFTRGWTFKGSPEIDQIYLRITGGLNGTPMGPYRDLLSDQDRWDLAHYVASLDEEPSSTSEDFVVLAAFREGKLPVEYDAPAWQQTQAALIPLAGQVIQDPPVRWWTPTTQSVTVRALWNGDAIGFLLEWNDPTGPGSEIPDSALLQFAAQPGGRPYFLFGDAHNPVKVWHWQEGGITEEWVANGSGKIKTAPASFRVTSSWAEGRWHLIFSSNVTDGLPPMEGEFVPLLLSIRDGANGEAGNTRAISTWLWTTLAPPPSLQPWFSGLAGALGTLILLLLIFSPKGKPDE
ncbi:MAG: c-type cytochrome [Gammaproteobacteria bacterium]|nr:c-type cytochrome [Gammaproteobacteria bacterium]